MKMIHKMIPMLLVAAMLLSTGAAAAAASSISMSDEVNLTGMNTASVTKAVKNYFEARADYLLGNRTEMDWPVIGIVNDESAHMEQYIAKDIILQETSYIVESTDCYDAYAEVDAVETISYTKNGIACTEDILHKLRLYLNDENAPVVAADGYMELCSSFESCSYLAPETRTTSNTAEAGSSLCIVEIAEAEIGTVEGTDDDTKYGEWFGSNNEPWCAIFICWCADQANVATSVIPPIAGADSMLGWFRDENRYYRSEAYNGTYTPQPGDIIFIGEEEDNADHVGLVQKVVNGRVWVIDGNSSDKVNNYPYRLTSSDIVGYGNPAYESSGHTYSGYVTDADCHWQECTVCGHTTEKTVHLPWNTYSYDATTHWKTCRTCAVVVEMSAHVLVLGVNGKYECQLCDCPNVSIGLVKQRRCLEG